MKELNAVETWYKELQFESLEEFLEFSSLNTPAHKGYIDFNQMIFRGHSHANSYKLTPNALRLRDGNLPVLKFHPAFAVIKSKKATINQVIEAEYCSLLQFYKTSNFNGLYTPGEEIFKDEYFLNVFDYTYKNIYEWYPSEIEELAAIAQHFGFLTRLLDWTFDFRVALYFALQEVNKIANCDKEENEDFYAIWCVNAGAIQAMRNEEFNNSEPPPCPIKFFVPSYSHNINLRAQSGLMSYSKAYYQNTHKIYQAETQDKTILDYIRLIDREYRNHHNDGVLMCKILIPTVNAKKEFCWLTEQGYHAAKLFPGYEGVVRKIDEDQWLS